MKEERSLVDFPIDPEILRKRKAIPGLISELSYLNKDKAVNYIRLWGEHRMPITEMFDDLVNTIQTEKDTL